MLRLSFRPLSALALALALALAMSGSVLAAAAPLDPSAIGARAEALLQAGRHAELEKLGTDYWAQDARVLGGNAALYHYYGALASSSSVAVFSYKSGAPIEAKQKALETWVTARPKAYQARVAFAQFWVGMATAIRGDSFADKVPPDVWARYEYALNQARTLLEGIPDEDPHGYYVRIELAHPFEDVRARMDAVYAAAVKRFPTYFHYYSQRATYLQERWYGKPGDLARFLRSLSAQPGGDAGRVAYAYAANTLMALYPRPTLLNDTGLEWDKIKVGYAAREKKYGLRNRDWNALLNLAPTGLDRVTAQLALDHVGADWDPAVWQQKKHFDDVVAWIRQEGPQTAARVEWSFPREFEHTAPTPHFKCSGKSQACDVQVADWDPAVARAERRRRLLADAAPFVKDAVEPAAQIQRHGAGAAVEYVTLTHKGRQSQFRYMTRGFFERGPASIRFVHLGNSLEDRQRFLDIIHSVQPRDALLLVGQKLAAYAAACARLNPALAPQHRQALHASVFKNVAERPGGAVVAEVNETLARSPASHRDRICDTLSGSVREAEESLRTR